MIGNMFKRGSKIKVQIFWTDGSIPAHLFFYILLTRDLSKLGTGDAQTLESVFEKIYDEYIELDNNQKVVQWYKKQNKIALLNLQINVINNILHALVYLPLSVEERNNQIDNLNSIKGVTIQFSKNKPFLDEVSRIQNVVLGSLKNRINMETITEGKQKNAVKYSFEDDIVSIENVLGRNVDENVSLRKFVKLKNSAKDKVESQKRSSHGRK